MAARLHPRHKAVCRAQGAPCAAPARFYTRLYAACGVLLDRRKGSMPPAALFAVLLFPLIAYFATLGMILLEAPRKSGDQADVAVVLGTAPYAGEKINPCLRARVEQAVKLYKQKRVTAVLFSGGGDFSLNLNEAELMRQLAIEGGMDPRYIFTEAASRSTYENIIFSKQGLDYYQARSILLVSEPYHLPRARRVAEKYLAQRVRLAPAEESPCWRTFPPGGIMLVREPLAFWWYHVKGWM